MANLISNFVFARAGIPKFNSFLDVSSFRHKLVAGNIANASTPGYRSQSIDFHTEVRKRLGESDDIAGATTHANHIPLGSHPEKPPEVASQRVRAGEMNSVDMDQEISTMAQNELQYTIGAMLLQRKFDGIEKAITNK